MTDLLSSLADQILALINSKPSSPTKAEIEELIRWRVSPLNSDVNVLRPDYSAWQLQMAQIRGDGWLERPASYLVSQGALEKAMEETEGMLDVSIACPICSRTWPDDNDLITHNCCGSPCVVCGAAKP